MRKVASTITSRWAREGSVRVALPLDPRPNWFAVAEDLGEFLCRYREARGAKYWERRLT